MNYLGVASLVLTHHLRITAKLEEGIQEKEEITAHSEIPVTEVLAHTPTSRFSINIQKSWL